MIVIVGRTHLEEHEIDFVRNSIGNRITVLEKARKANEAADLSTREADDDIVLGTRLRSLFDYVKHPAEETRRTQADLFTGRPSQSPEEATRDAAAEADRRIRHREIVRVIGGIMISAPEEKTHRDDEELREALFDQFHSVEHGDAEGEPGEKKWPGIYRHETQDGKVVWCAVSTEGGVERFWYDVDPELTKFNPEALAPTLTGDALLPILREAWGLPDPAVREKELRATVVELMQGFTLSGEDLEAIDEDDDAFGNLVAGHLDRVTE
jgi:hypothetical protein